MKFSTQEEYGLRCLLHIARQGSEGSQTIPEISRAEGLSNHYVAKLMRILRQAGFVESVRGQAGGYALTYSPDEIQVGDVLNVLGGRFFDNTFCKRHSGGENRCVHASANCALRSLWYQIQKAVDEVLTGLTLLDLIQREIDSENSGKTISESIPPEESLNKAMG